MRILLLTQWFEPEPAFKGLVFAKALRERGHEVEVLTGFPNYPGGKVYPGHRIRPYAREVMDGIRITRVALYPSHDQSRFGRAFNYVSFALTASLAGLVAVKRPDVVYVYHPPATIALPALLIKFFRRCKLIYDIQDLWPDTLSATGMFANHKLLAIVGSWCRLIYQHADRLVVLSDGFRQRLLERGVPEWKIQVIRNWSPDEGTGDAASLVAPILSGAAFVKQRPGLTVIYAGNMGRAQNLRVLLPAMADARVREAGIRLVLVGGGLEWNSIQERTKELALDNVDVLPPVSKARAAEMIRAADAALVHLRSDPLFEITIPSKVQSYLMAGVPVLAGLTGDGRALIEAAGAGVLFEPDEPYELVRALLRLNSMSPADRSALGRSGACYYQQYLSLARASAEVDAQIKDLYRTAA